MVTTGQPSPDHGFTKRRPERPEYPRRVRGGLRLASKDWPMPLEGLGGRLLDALVEGVAETLVREAFNDYAVRGQVRTLELDAGRLVAAVQGRRPRAYAAELGLRRLDHAAWQRVVSDLVDDPAFATQLLARELPSGLDAVFERAGGVFTPRPGEFELHCSCNEEGRPCKHLLCVGMHAAEMLEQDPFVLFALRGMPVEELLEALRQRRAVTSSSTGTAAALAPAAVPEAEHAARPLETILDLFWEAGPELDTLETSLRPPEVSHPLLRRLGPSPFEDGRFPLVGLLATCYDLVSEHAMRDEDLGSADAAAEAGGADDRG